MAVLRERELKHFKVVPTTPVIGGTVYTALDREAAVRALTASAAWPMRPLRYSVTSPWMANVSRRDRYFVGASSTLIARASV